MTGLYIVDSFADAAFRGNPAGVVLLEQPRPESWMQSVAAELRHSETAFAVRRGPGEWDLRWFTPAAEVDLCGHATLATGHVLGGDNVFHTRSGDLRTSVTGQGWVEMDFPADPARPAEATDDLRRGLGGVEVVAVARGVSDLLVQVATAEMVAGLQPDFAAIARLPERGVIVTAAAKGGEADVVSRCFYPAYGVPEDPVTGSAHCTLGSWWCPRLGKNELLAHQLSARGGAVRVTLNGDRIVLAGRAVTVVSGTIEV